MANTHSTLASLFTDIAKAIRSKTGSSASIVADQFPDAIAAIDTQENLDAELTAQDDLIARINTALEGKAGGNTSAVITFYIDGVAREAEEGMTWYDWCDSEYNIDNYYTAGEYEVSDKYYTEFIDDVSGNDVIEPGRDYSVTYIG